MDKFGPDKKPVWSDKTCVYSNWCCGPVIKLQRSIFEHKLHYIVFALDLKCPVTVSDQVTIFPVKTGILADNNV